MQCKKYFHVGIVRQLLIYPCQIENFYFTVRQFNSKLGLICLLLTNPSFGVSNWLHIYLNHTRKYDVAKTGSQKRWPVKLKHVCVFVFVYN